MEPDETIPSWFEPHRRIYERLVLASFCIGCALAIAGLAGAILLAIPMPTTATAVGVGLLLLLVSLDFALPLRHLRTWRPAAGGTAYDRLKRWKQVKMVSITANLLVVAASVLLMAASAVRLGLVEYQGNLGFGRGSLFVALALLISLSLAGYLSFRTAPETPSGPRRHAYFRATAITSLLAATLAMVVVRTPLAIGPLRLDAADAPFLVLLSATLTGIALLTARSLPSLYVLFPPDARAPEARGKSLLITNAIAFSLLFLVLLAASAFEIGFTALFATFRSGPFIIGILAVAVSTLAAGVWVIAVIARNTDRVPLFRVRMNARRRREAALVAGSALLTLPLAALAVWLALGHRVTVLGLGPGRWVDLACLALLAGFGPFGFYFAHRRARVRKLEERFPDFLRDLASGRRAGLTLAASATLAAEGQYGELTPEIRKMADQLALNVPFEEAITRLAQRVDTPLVRRDCLLINEAARAGGQITDVLEAAAQDAREVKALETERRSTMSLYTLVIYIIFGVFLMVVAILYASFIPPFLQATQAAAGANLGSLQLKPIDPYRFRNFYFLTALVQAIGNGFIAGVIESGVARSGLRHGFVMVLITYVAFVVFLN